MLPPAFAVLSLGCLLPVARRCGLGWGFEVALVLAAAPLGVGCARFALQPEAAPSRLEPLARLYSAVATIGFTLALLWARGVR